MLHNLRLSLQNAVYFIIQFSVERVNKGPSVPHINLWEPRYFTKVPGGPQTYTLDVLWLQEKAAQIHMSE